MMTAIARLTPLVVFLLLAFSLNRPGRAAGGTEATDEQLKLGEKVFVTHCKSCHLERGKSRIKRLNLSDDNWMHGSEIAEIEKNVAEGIAASQMQPFKEKLSREEIQAVAQYVKSLSLPPAQP